MRFVFRRQVPKALNEKPLNFVLNFQNCSILVVLMFSWQINANLKLYVDLGEVYYGKEVMNFS